MRISRQKARVIGNKLGMNWKDYDLNEFRMGLEVELEHKGLTRGNLVKTGMIARDHLRELPDYYSRLREMEKGR